MNDRCKHNTPQATCCACLTEVFRGFEEDARRRREQRAAVLLGIRTDQSGVLGTVTIPE